MTANECIADRAGPVARSDIDALWGLARKGAYAAPAEGGSAVGDRTWGVFSPRNDFAEAIAVIPAAAFATARRCGWIAPEAGAERYQLSAAGIKALRQARCGQAKPAGTARSASRPAPAPPSPRRALPGTRASREGSLAWLRQRRDKDGQPLVTEAQFDAGERLATDYWHAQLMPRVTADWSAAAASRRTRRAAPGAGVELGDNVVAARQRVARALTAVGPELAGILVDVCCHEVGLATAERAHGLPQRSGKIVLQLALTSLARHYGIIIAPSPMAARMRHWGTGDYRPDIEAWR